MPSNIDLSLLDTMSRVERLEFERSLVSSSSLSDDLLSRLEVLIDDKQEWVHENE